MSSSLQNISPLVAREKLFGERRWTFCKTFVEPHIAKASNDDTATALLPNHEFLIRSGHSAICVVKCRKTAHSWGISLKALARAATEDNSTTIIGSYDEDEAREKLNFLNWQYKVLPEAMRTALGMSEGSEVRYFRNGSRIRFISRKAPTGAGASIEWDEFSVEKAGTVTAQEILAAALGCTTHTGTVSIGGTQRGPHTTFNEIVTGEINKKVKDNPLFAGTDKTIWKVRKFPWWTSPALCTDVVTARGFYCAKHGFQERGGAWDMPTEARVERFGNDKLKNQYLLYLAQLGLEMFQREFEMLVLDDKESYYDIEFMRLCYDVYRDWATPDLLQIDIEGGKYGIYGDALKPAKILVDRLAMWYRNNRYPGELGLSMDIGRDRDVDEIWVGLAPHKDKETLLPLLNIGMSNMEFDGKIEILRYMMQALKISRGLLDGTKGSVGRQLTEQMKKETRGKLQPFIFNNISKSVIVTGLKARGEAGKLALPPKTPKFEKLEREMLGLKKMVSKANVVTFDVDRSAKSHADCVMSLAMLSEMFTMPRRVRTAHSVIVTPGSGAIALPGAPTFPALPRGR